MEFGIFKGRAVAGSEQFGETTNGNLQIALTMRMTVREGLTQEWATVLIFSPESAKYSRERLVLLGWDGKVGDVTDLRGIDKNEVDVRLWQDSYQGKAQIKCEIMTGARMTFDKPLTKDEFKRRLAAMTGHSAAGGSGDKPDIPF